MIGPRGLQAARQAPSASAALVLRSKPTCADQRARMALSVCIIR